MTEAGVVIRAAVSDDLPGILSVQHQAFGRVARAFGLNPDDLPPLRETLADLTLLIEQGTRFLVAASPDGAVVGSVRASDTDGVVEIGRLVVANGWLRRGVATRLMERLEAGYPRAQSFVLFTGADAFEPLALYKKLGYTVSRSEDVGPVVLVWLQKPGPASKR